MVREYTYVDMQRNWNKEEIIYAFYWEDGKRKVEKLINRDYYIYIEKENFNSEIAKTDFKEFKTVNGKTVIKVHPLKELSPEDFVEWRERQGRTYESDFPALDRWLCSRKPPYSKKIRKFYFDIETIKFGNNYSPAEEAKGQIVSIAVYDSFEEQYYLLMYHPKEKIRKETKDGVKYNYYETETSMLKAFIHLVSDIDPDYFYGWNIEAYDMLYLFNRCENLYINIKPISPIKKVYLKRGAGGKIGANTTKVIRKVKIAGRGVFDMINAARRIWLGSGGVGYKLENIASKYLGEGKIKIPSTDELWKNDREQLAKYNIKDVKLCVDLDKAQHITEVFQGFQELISINLEDSIIQSKLIYYYLKQKTDIVLMNSNKKHRDPFQGGYCFKTKIGLFDNAIKFDYISMHPSQIVSCNISPDTIVLDPKPEDDLIRIKGENTEICFKKEPGIISMVTKALLDNRIKAKKAGDKHKALALKIFINSIYGTFASEYSRFFSQECAKAVTLASRELITKLSDRIKDEIGYETIAGDTDSLVLWKKDGKHDDADKVLDIAKITFDKFEREWNLPRKPVWALELEDVIDRIILFGLKKKYAEKIKDKKIIIGIEIVRSDTAGLSVDLQKELVDYMLYDPSPKMEKLLEIENKYYQKLKELDYEYIGLPGVIRKDAEDYKTKTMALKALNNSGLNMGVGERFQYVIGRMDTVTEYIEGPYAFKRAEEVPEKFFLDYKKMKDRLITKKIEIFKLVMENKNITQKSLSDYL